MRKPKLAKKQRTLEAEAEAPFRWSHKAIEGMQRAMSKTDPDLKTWRKARHEKKRWADYPTHDMDGSRYINY